MIAFLADGVPSAGAEVAIKRIPSFHTTLLHHGMVIVGLPYSEARLMDNSQVSGGSPCGATTITGPDGARQPSEHELAMARSQGEHVAGIAAKPAR